MKKASAVSELQKLKGIGEVLAKRFVAAGIDTFPKIVAAGEDRLKTIPGLQPGIVPSIISQAAELVKDSENTRAEQVEEVKHRNSLLKERVHGIALELRQKLHETDTGPRRKKLERQVVKLMSAFEKVEAKLEGRPGKWKKALAKAGKRLDIPSDASLKKIGKGLKKARKALQGAAS